MNKNKLNIIPLMLVCFCFNTQAKDLSQTSFTVNENGTPIPVESTSPITPFIASNNNMPPTEAINQISKLNNGNIEPTTQNIANDKKTKIGLDALNQTNIWTGKINNKSETSNSSTSITRLQVEPIILTTQRATIEQWNKTTQNEFTSIGKQKTEEEYLKFLNK